MLKKPDQNLFSINTVIGQGTKFIGDLILDGIIRIDGEFFGAIYTRGKVIVGASGIAHNSIVAGEIVVGGAIFGNAYAVDEVRILAGSHIHGDIVTSHLNIENGAIFEGNCRIDTDLTYETLCVKAGLKTPPKIPAVYNDPRDTWNDSPSPKELLAVKNQSAAE